MRKKTKYKKKKIGVIIVHFGDSAVTSDCLQSLQQVSKGNYILKIFLIDNDPKHRMLEKQFTSGLDITRIVSPHNGGFAYGVNKGIIAGSAAGCEYLLFLNNDTVVEPNFFKVVLPYFKKNKHIGMISPMLVYYDDPQKIWCTHGKVNQTFLFTTYPYMNKNISSVRFPELLYSDFGAAALLVKADVCKQVGLLDEKYFLFGEDVEWCLRAKKAGFLLTYVPKPLVLHKVSATSGEKGTNMLTPRGSYLYARNFFYILADHRDWFNLFTAVFGQLCIRAPFYMFMRMRSIAARQAYLRGLYDGFYYLCTKRIIPSVYLEI